MTPRSAIFLLLAALPPAAGAQVSPTVARTGVVFESYAFGPGLAFERVTELSVPLVVTQRFGRRLSVDVGTGYVRASVREVGGATIAHDGFLDTDVRASLGVIPGRLVFTLVGTLPTGSTAVPDTTIPLFGAMATDLLGFTTVGFGSGGGLSAGFASAFPLGTNWAIGTAASYRYGAAYTPVRGGGELEPGGEVRVRFGIEGPFGPAGRHYFRGAVMYTTSGANALVASGEQSVIGDRALAYAAVSMPLGRSTLSLYGWDLRRLRARDSGAPATLAVPRGNVLALGARLDRPLSPAATLSPLLEFRHELTGSSGRMELLGYLVRAGSDFRYRLGDQAVGVLQAQLAVGALHSQGTRISIFGPRLGAFLEWSR
ncbi:MAG: hypothetical protein ACREMN_11195 [Gemmatimonadales bacterium]